MKKKQHNAKKLILRKKSITTLNQINVAGINGGSAAGNAGLSVLNTCPFVAVSVLNTCPAAKTVACK